METTASLGTMTFLGMYLARIQMELPSLPDLTTLLLLKGKSKLAECSFSLIEVLGSSFAMLRM
jgi:hypothetical protein